MKHCLHSLLATLLFFQSAFAQLPNQDCIGAIQLCNGRHELRQNVSGRGLVNDLDSLYLFNNNFCLLNGENNSVWYKMEFGSQGMLVFSIEPISNADDYDFALFNATGYNCSDISSGIAPFVRCNYALTMGTPTGLAYGYSDVSASPNGDALLAPVPVDSGEVFYLMVDNFTRNGQGFAIDFVGTTAVMISEDTLAVSQGYSTLLPDTIKTDLFFNRAIDCGSLSSDFSEFTVVDDNGNNLRILSVSCNAPTGHVTINTVNPPQPVTYITVTFKVGTDGNSIASNCGNPLATNSKLYSVRNAPGVLDFNHVQVSNIFTFTPVAPVIGNVEWYINFVPVGTNAINQSYTLPINVYQPYVVCLEADYGYVKDSVCKYYYITGLDDLMASHAFIIYPNPARGEVSISLPFGASTLEIMDINGKTVRQFTNVPVGKTMVIGTTDLPEGLYLVRVAHSNGIAIQKLQVLY